MAALLRERELGVYLNQLPLRSARKPRSPQQEDGLITSTGVATWARLVNGNEVTALDLDCSGTDGSGGVKLASTNLYLGGDARMVSAILG